MSPFFLATIYLVLRVMSDIRLENEEGKKQVSFRVLADTYRILEGGRRSSEDKPATAQ